MVNELYSIQYVFYSELNCNILFQNDEPPEITYCVVGGEGGLALQAVTPTHPMPPQDELDAKFAELVVSTFMSF